LNADENQLAARAQAGDARAFEALIRREKVGLYAFVRRYVGDSDQAYDLLQESLVAAWRALKRYDPERPFGAWLRRIALNKCHDHSRRARVRRLMLAAFSLEPRSRSPQGPPAPDPREERLARLDAAIARLPAVYRDPLLLTTAGGLSHVAAAGVLGLSAKAVEMRLYRARRRLAELLEDMPEG
jgi:RNA polymerase sigma-70 factor (ECF subfamily)